MCPKSEEKENYLRTKVLHFVNDKEISYLEYEFNETPFYKQLFFNSASVLVIVSFKYCLGVA